MECGKHVMLIFFVSSLPLRMVEAKDHKIILESGYNLQERPKTSNSNKPLLIKASVNLRNILQVSEKEQLVSLETTLRLFWKDMRIKPRQEHIESEDSIGQYITLNPSKAGSIWMPDIFIDQVKTLRVPSFFTRPASLRVYNDSTIRYSSRFNFDVACNMDFHRFPVDEQYCQVKFESFGFTNKQIHLEWMDLSQSHVNTNISLAQFEFKVTLADTYSTDYYDTSYPGLIMKLYLRRQLTYHIVQTYIPSSVFVVIAWLSLFVPPESVPGRVGMGMTTLLTLTAMFSSVRQNVPKVSYVSLLDIWMLVCMIFVFASILEFIVVTVYLRSGRKLIADKVESVSKILIPLLYFVFNIVYWPNVLVQYFDGK